MGNRNRRVIRSTEMRDTPVYFPGLQPDRYRIKAVAIAVPERFAKSGLIDENRQSFELARRFDLEGGLSTGEKKRRVLVCLSNLPESRMNGSETTIRWPLLPVSTQALPECWLLILGHESINLKINSIARRITKAHNREGKSFAWYSFNLGKMLSSPTENLHKATIRGISIFPPLPAWKASINVAKKQDNLTEVALTVVSGLRRENRQAA